MTIEIEHLMDETSKMLTEALEKIIGIDKMLTFVLGSAGNTTQEAINILLSEDDEALDEFLQSDLLVEEMALVDQQISVPTTPMKTKSLKHNTPAKTNSSKLVSES